MTTRKRFCALMGAELKSNTAVTIAWNWFRVGAKHGANKRISKTDLEYLTTMMQSATEAEWNKLEWRKKK